MTVTRAEVVRHFLRLEATRSKYSDRKAELLSWCDLSDSDLITKARQFADERDDVNPALVYTVGVRNDSRYRGVVSWTRQRVRCKDMYVCGISPAMRCDIDTVRGNLLAFSLRFSGNYTEFRPLAELCELSSIVIVVCHRQDNRDGEYEIVDGVHRLVAFCCARIEDADAYVAHMGN